MQDQPAEKTTIVRAAVPCPLFQSFDYLYDRDLGPTPTPGQRALVPFGSRKLIAYIISIENETNSPFNKLKKVIEIYDEPPLFDANMLNLLKWCSFYYCHPIGECAKAAAPAASRKPGNTPILQLRRWNLKNSDFQPRPNAKHQQKTIELIKACPEGIWETTLITTGIPATTLTALANQGVIDSELLDPVTAASMKTKPPVTSLSLNEEQTNAVKAFSSLLEGFKVGLLEGVTGSGKTEVYIELVRRCLTSNKQALILVPEINLTPQTVKRFQDQLGIPVSPLHSALSDKEKLTTQRLAQNGTAKIVIGTRSSIFTPFKQLGLIIVDEEHDPSFKQSEGFKYSGRDVAIKRAQIESIGVLLGSATPSLESLNKVEEESYLHATLKKRAGKGSFPNTQLIDIRSLPISNGLSLPLIEEIKKELKASNQILIFQNRRGFAPTLMCPDCGWISQCEHCDARYTVHLNPPKLHCHHCDFQTPIYRQCPNCGSNHLTTTGSGTERIEQGLAELFPETNIIRFDRDSINNHKVLEAQLLQVKSGEPCILVGTQMLTKGHDFSNVTLVCVVDADSGFFSADYRAIERSAQQLIQVAGRTGRGMKAGRVLIQSKMGDHPAFNYIKSGQYRELALAELLDRKHCSLPPFSKMITIRAESRNQESAKEALIAFSEHLHYFSQRSNQLDCAGPLDAQIARKSGIHRAFYHLFIRDQPLLKQVLSALPPIIRKLSSNRVKLFIDVDPVEYL